MFLKNIFQLYAACYKYINLEFTMNCDVFYIVFLHYITVLPYFFSRPANIRLFVHRQVTQMFTTFLYYILLVIYYHFGEFTHKIATIQKSLLALLFNATLNSLLHSEREEVLWAGISSSWLSEAWFLIRCSSPQSSTLQC